MSITEDTRSDTTTAVPAPKVEHRADIQGLRAIAVLLVVAFHTSTALPGGFIGVDVFFVISGFVITQLLWRELHTSERLSFSHFYARRVRRILPALAVLIIAVSAMSALIQNPLGPQRKTAAGGAAAATFFANFYSYGSKAGYFDPTANSNPILHTWSLSVEEQFYLIFPLLLVGAVFLARRFAPRLATRTAAVWAVGTVAVLSFVLSDLTTRGVLSGLLHAPRRFAYYGSFTRAWEFAAGALLALVVTKLSRLHPKVALGLGVIGALLVLYSARTFTRASPFPGTIALIPVIGTVLLIVAGTRSRHGTTRLLSTKPMVMIGDVSYGWYLWHWPFIVFTGLLWSTSTMALTTAAIVALVPTYLSYRYVEQPIRFNQTIRGRRAVLVACVCIGVPLIVCGALALSARAASRTPPMRTLAGALRLHADETRHCESTAPIAKRPARCTWHASDPRGAVWLIGDSNAGHFTEPVAQAATQDGFDLHVATNAGCPFADLVLMIDSDTSSGCRRFVTESVATLVALHPQLVVVASDATGYINSSTYRFRDPHTGRIARSPAEKARVWATALSSTLHQFERAHIPSLIVHTVPHFGSWDLGSCAAVRVYVDLASCGASASRASIRRQQQPALEAEHEATAGMADVSDMDLTSDLCTPTLCRTNHGNRFVYRDYRHLTIDGVRTLTPRFDQAFRAILPGPHQSAPPARRITIG